MIKRLLLSVVCVVAVDCFASPSEAPRIEPASRLASLGGYRNDGGRAASLRGATATKQSIKAIHANNLALGTPSKADVVVNREGYALGYSEKHEQPLWVMYELTREEVKNKKVHRSSVEFQPDPEIPTESAQLSDYRRSGYDRGHMAPAADMRWSQEAMKECFYLSNICPQENRFNAGNWVDLEQKMRHWASCYGAIWIVTGPIFGDGGGSLRGARDDAKGVLSLRGEAEAIHAIGANRVTVPTAFYKVVYCPARQQGIGFILPHRQEKKAIRDYATTIDVVETATGLDFFSGLEDSKEEQLESELQINNWLW